MCGGKVASFPPDSISGGAASSASDHIELDESLGAWKHRAVVFAMAKNAQSALHTAAAH